VGTPGVSRGAHETVVLGRAQQVTPVLVGDECGQVRMHGVPQAGVEDSASGDALSSNG